MTAITHEEEVALVKRYKEDKDVSAYQELVTSQIGWAKTLASQFCDSIGWKEFDEAKSAAQLGLCLAVERFNPEKSRLTTWVTPWVYRELRTARRATQSVIQYPAWLDGNPDAKATVFSMHDKEGFLIDDVAEPEPVADEVSAELEVALKFMLEAVSDLPKKDQLFLRDLVIRGKGFREYAIEEGKGHTHQAVHAKFQRLRNRLNRKVEELVRV